MKMKQTNFKQTEIGEIPEEWDVVNIRDIGKVVTGKTPPTKDKDNYGNKWLFVRIPDMGNEVYITNTGTKLSDKGATFMRRLRLPPNSIMVSCIATVGQVGLSSQDCFTNQQINSIIPLKEKVFPKWVYYFFKNNTHYLQSHGGGGSVYTNISKSKFENLSIAIPSLNVQSSITKILSDLDSQIENLQAQNETLEAIGKALFKHWFVDFEFPDEHGKPYKSSGGKMKKTELGEVPEGWKLKEFEKEFHLTMGQSPPGESYNKDREGEIFFQGRAEFGVRFPQNRLFCTDPRRMAEAGDTLMSVRAPVGDINQAVERCCIGRGLSAIRHHSTFSTYTFYFMSWFRKQLEHYEANGTVFGSINKNDLSKTLIISPDKKTLELFNQIINSCDEKILVNYEENLTLSKIRDSLLPKLMSGKIRVKV
jgi:type I restriction enzyme S subunit